MFIKAGYCPVCFEVWKGNERCVSCGSVAEIYYERELPRSDAINRTRLQKTIDRARARLAQYQDDGVARYVLGLAYTNLGLLAEGLAEIRKAARLLPEKTRIAYEAVAVAAKQEIFTEDTLNQIDAVVERQPDFPEALFLKGIILDKLGRRREAVRAWQAAYKKNQEYMPARVELHTFIRDESRLLRDPHIVQTLQTKGLSQGAHTYLKLINTPRPSKPPPLGKTSMRILNDLSASTAKRMRQMYAEDIQQYEKAMRRRHAELERLENDLITLSNLCMAAQAVRSRSISQTNEGDAGRRLSVEERSAILDRAIQSYQKRGYRLVSRTETTAQLSKQHQFSCCLAVILVLLIIGIILYLLYYLTAKKEYLLYLEVDEYGRLHTSHA